MRLSAIIKLCRKFGLSHYGLVNLTARYHENPRDIFILSSGEQKIFKGLTEKYLRSQKDEQNHFYENLFAVSLEQYIKSGLIFRNQAQVSEAIAKIKVTEEVPLLIRVLQSLWHLFYDRVSQAGPQGKEARKNIAVILVSFANETLFTELTLKAVRKFTDFPYEITIINNSTKNVGGFKNSLLKKGLFDAWLDMGAPTHPKGLQQALRYARKYRYVVTLDADAVPFKYGWLGGLIKKMNQENSGLIGPMRKFGNDPEIILRVVHPACMVIDQDKIEGKFQIDLRNYGAFWDTCGLLTWDCIIHKIPISYVSHELRGDSLQFGKTFINDAVCHCWYASRIIGLDDNDTIDGCKVKPIREKVSATFEELKKKI